MKVEQNDQTPLCPHCKRELDAIYYKEHGVVNVHYVYSCPHCKTLLGIGSTFIG